MNDQETLTQAARWLRFMATEGLYRSLHAIEADALMDLALRFDEMRERVSKTGVLQSVGEYELERARR